LDPKGQGGDDDHVLDVADPVILEDDDVPF
jgi:hypothetical protein